VHCKRVLPSVFDVVGAAYDGSGRMIVKRQMV